MNAHTYDTGLNASHLSADWSIPQALAELLQNTLDERRRGADASWQWTGGFATFIDNGKGIAKDGWIFGYHADASNSSIGQYGNGMKRALAVLHRSGRNVLCETAGYIMCPRVSTSGLDGATVETLWLDFAPNDRVQGTMWRVECGEAEYKDCLDFFIETCATVYETVQEATGDGNLTIRVMEPGRSIYINGARVEMLNSVFSYNISGDEPRGWTNESRRGANRQETERAIRRNVAFGCRALVSLFNGWDNDKGIWEGMLSLSYNNDKDCVKAFHMVYGKNAVRSGQLDNRDTQYAYAPVGLPYSWYWRCLDAPKLAPACPQAHGLDEEERSNLEAAKRIVRRARADLPRVKVAEEITLDNGTYALGLWSDGVIILSRGILRSRRTTLAVLLHEAAHWISGDDDCTSGHARAIQELAAKIILA